MIVTSTFASHRKSRLDSRGGAIVLSAIVSMRSPMHLPLCLLLVALGAAMPRAVVAQGGCIDDAQCADGNLCNGIERCVAGSCTAAPPLTCDDGDACTEDFCDPAAGCGHHDVACPATCGPADDGIRCSDGTACTTGDTCSGGSCVGTPLACDDGDPCTTDGCDAQLGCVYHEEPHPPACITSSDCGFAADHVPCVADGDPCTQDGCLLGVCQVGLLHFQRQCADGDACNGDEFCSPVKGCEPGPPPSCDDGNACNGVETCDSGSGCQPGTPLANGTPCDDGRLCSSGDSCAGGTCTGTAVDCDDGDGATADLCTEATGCLHCARMSQAKLTLTFPAANRTGAFGVSGTFAPLGAFDVTGPNGATLLVHDGTEVIQQSHVAGSAFMRSGHVLRFADRSGSAANGLTRLRLREGAAQRRFAARGVPTGVAFGGNAANSVTVVAGPSCATVDLACALTRNGKTRRCR